MPRAPPPMPDMGPPAGLTHTSPPRVPAWQLSAWPERDPECKECLANHSHGIDTHEMEVVQQDQGSPMPMKMNLIEHSNLQRQNMRMMHTRADAVHAIEEKRAIAAHSPPRETPGETGASRKQTFQLFQCNRDGAEWMYAFDLQQAFEAMKIAADDQQVAILLRKFNLQAGDLLSLSQFNAFCDILESGIIPADLDSPQREHSPPVPGSPQYEAGKKEKPGPSNKPPPNYKPYHKQMDEKVCVPEKVRVRHNFDEIVPYVAEKKKKGKR